jgi:hypothetical protein
MPDRRVSVELELEIARLLRGGADAVGVFRRVRSSVDELGDKTDGASRDMEELAATTTLAGRQVDDLGDEALGAAASLAVLERQIHSVDRAARGLDINVDVDTRGGGMAGVLPTVSSMVRAGSRAGAGFAEGFSDAMGMLPGRLRGVLITALVFAIAAAAPLIGAMLGGIISAAVAVGGIGGGIAMASKDPRVRAAAKNFGNEITKEFFSGGEAFVRPVIASLNILADAFRQMDLGGSFARLAPHVTKLADGIGEMANNIMPGLNRAFDRAGPFIDQLADGLAEMGSALGYFFDEASKSEGAIHGLHAAFNLLNNVIVFTGTTIRLLSDSFDIWIRETRDLFGVLANIPGPMQDMFKRMNKELDDLLSRSSRLPPAMDLAAGAAQAFGAAAGGAAGATGRLAGALSVAHSKFLDFQGAEISAEAALDDFQEAIKESNGSLNVHNEKGRAARQMLLLFAQASIDAATKKGIETGSVKEADRVYESYRQQLFATIRPLVRTKEEAQRLVNQWLAYARLPNIQKTVETRIITRRLNYTSNYLQPGDIQGRQHGGPVLAGELYRVNEAGMEFFRPAMSGHVTPLAPRPYAASPVMAGGGGNTYAISVYVAPGGNLREAGAQTVKAIQAYEQANSARWRQ